MHYCCCFVSGVGLRPRKYGGGGHASFAGRDFPPAPVCTPLKQNGGIAAKRIAYVDSLGSAHAAVYCSTPLGLNIRRATIYRY